MTRPGDPADPDQGPEPTPTPKRSGFQFPKFKLPAFPSLGSERHEVLSDLPPTPREPATDEPSPPQRPTARLLGLSRETRVGVAALLSFVVLVAALVVRKVSAGKNVPTLAINGNPADNVKPAANKEKEKDKPATEPRKSNETKKDPNPTPPASNPPLPKEEVPRPAPLGAPVDTPPNPSDVPGVPPPTEPSPTVPTPPTNEPDLPTFPGAIASASKEDPKPPEKADDLLPPPGVSPTTSPLAPTPTPADPGKAPAPPSSVTSSPEPPPRSGLEPSSGSTSVAIPPMTVTPNDPVPAPAPTAPEPSTPRPIAAAPVPAERSPRLEPFPGPGPGPVAESAEAVAAAPSMGSGWVVIPSGGKRTPGTSARALDDSPRAADGPRPRPAPAEADQFEPVVHKVQPGENFWTISQLYYHSSRYYVALHAANARQVPKIDELYEGTVLRIPPPEELDRALILPAIARPRLADEPNGSKVTRTSRKEEGNGDVPLTLPTTRPRRVRPTPAPDPEVPDEPRRPSYTVKTHETLRSIARDTLGDPRRDRDILLLNREILDDPTALSPGTVLTLPEDAVIVRKGR